MRKIIALSVSIAFFSLNLWIILAVSDNAPCDRRYCPSYGYARINKTFSWQTFWFDTLGTSIWHLPANPYCPSSHDRCNGYEHNVAIFDIPQPASYKNCFSRNGIGFSNLPPTAYYDTNKFNPSGYLDLTNGTTTGASLQTNFQYQSSWGVSYNQNCGNQYPYQNAQVRPAVTHSVNWSDPLEAVPCAGGFGAAAWCYFETDSVIVLQWQVPSEFSYYWDREHVTNPCPPGI
ncbi:hypothetical protein HYR99_20210 [Candidatus Poribacteria bacterium]|nr:hypothetical protein [Candidatus Poribacteria bacterium]